MNESSLKKTDVEQIVAEIKAEIGRDCDREEILSFGDIAYENTMLNFVSSHVYNRAYLEDKVVECERRAHVEWRHPILGGTMTRKVKRIIRKLAGFIVRPVVDEQNAFNANAAEALKQMLLRLNEQEEEIHRLKGLLAEGDSSCE